MFNPNGWTVEFRGDQVYGSVQAATNNDRLSGVAGCVVISAVERGVGDSGDLVEGGWLKQRYHYEVVAIDHDKQVVTVELQP